MSKHTPGPWVLHTPDNYTPWIGSKTGPETLGGVICEAPVRYTSSMKDWEANARLIAAAPEMLEALKEVRRFLEHDEPVRIAASAHDRQLMETVDAAIAKAEGRAE